jgi:hypothetical protein
MKRTKFAPDLMKFRIGIPEKKYLYDFFALQGLNAPKVAAQIDTLIKVAEAVEAQMEDPNPGREVYLHKMMMALRVASRKS